MLWPCISILWHKVLAKSVFNTIPWFLHNSMINYKKSNWFYFLYWRKVTFIDLPKQWQCFIDQTLGLFEEYNIQKKFTQTSITKKVFSKIFPGNIRDSNTGRGEYRLFLRSVSAFGHTKIGTQVLIDQLNL